MVGRFDDFVPAIYFILDHWWMHRRFQRRCALSGEIEVCCHSPFEKGLDLFFSYEIVLPVAGDAISGSESTLPIHGGNASGVGSILSIAGRDGSGIGSYVRFNLQKMVLSALITHSP